MVNNNHLEEEQGFTNRIPNNKLNPNFLTNKHQPRVVYLVNNNKMLLRLKLKLNHLVQLHHKLQEIPFLVKLIVQIFLDSSNHKRKAHREFLVKPPNKLNLLAVEDYLDKLFNPNNRQEVFSVNNNLPKHKALVEVSLDNKHSLQNLLVICLEHKEQDYLRIKPKHKLLLTLV